MLVAIAAFAVVVFAMLLFARRKKKLAAESSVELEQWISGALERELAATIGGWGDDEHRRRLAKTLRGEPDPDIVGAIEEKVRAVEIEYVRYAHEADCAITLHVRLETGEERTASARLPVSSLPSSVRDQLTTGGATRAFRPWEFAWARART
jgi:hypothetical protein